MTAGHDVLTRVSARARRGPRRRGAQSPAPSGRKAVSLAALTRPAYRAVAGRVIFFHEGR